MARIKCVKGQVIAIQLVQCRDRLASEEVHTYGDLRFKAFGMIGRYLTKFLICISQRGASVGYLVFISQNMSSIVGTHTLTLSSYIFLLVPVEIALSTLSPFTIFVDICNVLVMAVVVKEDLQLFDYFSKRGDYKRWRVAVCRRGGGVFVSRVLE
ncbi:PREDICTED: amino acid transporter ANT1-like [Nelumbo nucifera]|uniref:Amino acid transporter ANT1-like n=2 Tax=Nelumbo nucifera TaxID=4432 RepID=A0A1U7Z664_NELNU|nr:PREDICTED: amino acid transporter ANT1-like [Nelumbo nucifera]DAD24456.1 TPA_asm: hypothetical protein HUJ06_025920 [Nelumbo nucifera]